MAKASHKETKAQIESTVMTMGEPICQSLGCEIIDVQWKKEGEQWYLRVFIDREPAVDLDLCAEVSSSLSDVLELAPGLQDNYMLEVSSPGVERPLKKPADFQRFSGKLCKIKLFNPRDGVKEFTGTLLGYSDLGVGITLDKTKQEMYFSLDEIAKANLKFKF